MSRVVKNHHSRPPTSKTRIFFGKSGEPGGNRTLNPQIKSSFEEARALESLMILNVVCADDGKGRHPGVTSTEENERYCSDFDEDDSAPNNHPLGKSRQSRVVELSKVLEKSGGSQRHGPMQRYGHRPNVVMCPPFVTSGLATLLSWLLALRTQKRPTIATRRCTPSAC